MSKFIDIKISPYALYDTLKALDNNIEDNEVQTLVITKEDNDLLLRVKRDYVKVGRTQEMKMEETK